MADCIIQIPTGEVQFVKELYPRLREDDAAIERYRHAIDRLPPICVARGRVLVDGFHRWQAHRREKVATIAAIDLGNLTDVEILKESVKRNASHGRQLETSDKKRLADQLYRAGTKGEKELAELLSITPGTLKKYLEDARRDEREELKRSAIDRWLNCEWESFRDAGKALGVNHETVAGWLGDFTNQFAKSPPDPHMTFDVWSFGKADDDAGTKSHFGRMPPQAVENLLWLYTEPGQIVFDPFAGGGTTIDVAKRMGRRVWASDLTPATPTLPIHQHDITKGWPDAAPKKVDFILLDPPYWQQAKGRYSESKSDLGNVGISQFRELWAEVVETCAEHLGKDGKLAFIVSPTQVDDGSVVDHGFEMYGACISAKLSPLRRIIVPYQTQQATGQQVQWAKDNKRLLKLYRDLGVFAK